MEALRASSFQMFPSAKAISCTSSLIPIATMFVIPQALEVTLTPVEPTTYRLTRIGDGVFNLSGVRPTIHDINKNGEMAGSGPLVPAGQSAQFC